MDEFRLQVREMAASFEMASAETAMDFLTGEYRPRRDLCLITFDGGLKSHYTDILPVLHDQRIRALFFPITSCLEERRVSPAHMNQILLDALGFEEYAGLFFRKIVSICPDAFAPLNVDQRRAAEAYPCEPVEVARFRYLLDFGMEPGLRDRAVLELFTTHISPEQEFSRTFYLSWDEARRMQKAGMCIGGHSHQHKPLAAMRNDELSWDLETCRLLMGRNLLPQGVWPFSYPDGKRDSFHIRAVRKLQSLGYHVAFSTEAGDNRRGSDLFTLCRTDCPKGAAVRAAGG
jgi:peptidoglycan/xylan/chitin deacetylase (PgdA/CDA1 family)